MAKIQCLCGDVELDVSGEPIVQLYCHCDHCQLAHGAAYVASAVYRASDVQLVSGEPRPFRVVSLPRYSCSNCGTRLFTQGSDSIRSVNAYLLPEGSFRPALHVYCKFARLPIVDGLPHYASVPERWGGSDEQLAWPPPASAASPSQAVSPKPVSPKEVS